MLCSHEDVTVLNERHPVYDSFDDMGLGDTLLQGIYSYGFQRPSTIQQRAIRPIVDGCDTIGQSQPGTGKTAAFLVGALARTDFGGNMCQALVLVPTRELALQIQKVACALGAQVGIRCHACIGGTARRHDILFLRAGQHVVVGTPGRVLDMIENGSLGIASLRVFILDEADEMLSCGFKDQIYSILRMLHPEVQVCLFTTTLPPDTLDLTEKFMRDPVRILVKRDELTLDGIHHFYVDIEKEEWKLDTICDLYESLMVAQSIVYCNTQRRADRLAQEMTSRDFAVSVMHAGLSQEERQIVMQAFQSGSCRVLISTDLLARGMDVQQVSLVINYDMPLSTETYLRRIGRSGCFGHKGCAINFVSHRDASIMRRIERDYATQIEELPADIANVI